MQGHNLNGLRVAILATDYVEQTELSEPKRALEQAGATTRIIAPKAGQIQSLQHVEKGERFQVDMTLEQATPAILTPCCYQVVLSTPICCV